MRKSFLALVVAASLQVILGTIFAATVTRPVFDETLYRVDVDRYREQGINRATLLAQQSASPPLMAVLAGLSGRLGPAGDFRAHRIPIVVLWLASVAIALVLARSQGSAPLTWTLFMLFCFPHVPTAVGTLMTEGPAMTMVLAALLCTVVGVASPARALPMAFAAGLCGGAAILFRHYSLAMAIAIPLTWLAVTRRWATAVAASVGVVGAFVVLYAIWGGMMSPSFVSTGGPEKRTSVGLNLVRPLSAVVFIGAYLAPLLAWRRVPRLALLAGASLAAGILVVLAGADPLGNGPILTAVTALARGHALVVKGLTAVVVGIALLAIAAVCLVTLRRWRELDLGRDAVWIFSALATVLFVGQQIGVGGGSPYYERYSFLVFPWATYAGLRVLLPAPGVPLGVGAAMGLLGQAMLWRYR